MSAFLSWSGPVDPGQAIHQLRSIRRLILMTLALEGWVALRYVPYSSRPGYYALLTAGLGVCAVLGWRDRFAWPATSAAFVVSVVTVVSAFPENANHQFLAIVLLALLAIAGFPHPDESSEVDAGRGEVAVAAVQAMRWIVAAGLAWSGLMKLRYGYWLSGEFLAFRIALDPDFARVFAPILSSAELARLTSLAPEAGAGPFRASAPLLVLASNLTWLAEIALPVGLFFERTRRVALGLALALILVIEAGALELFFGGLMVGLLLLFSHRDRLARLLPWIGAIYFLRLLWPELAPLWEEGAWGEAPSTLGLLAPETVALLARAVGGHVS